MLKDIRVLVSGCSGLLGSNICYLLQDKYSLIGLYHQTPPLDFLDEKFSVDICDESTLRKILKRYHPDVIIHCAGLTNVDACEDSYKLTREVNAIGTRNMVRHSPAGTKFIYISTDSVFDGGKGNYSETDLPCPLNNYAKTKLEGEWYVQQESENYLILRTNFFGRNSNGKTSFAEWVLGSLMNKKKIRMVTDWYFSTIYAGDLAEIIRQLIEIDAKGLYHAGGSSKCSKYEFGKKLAEIFDLDGSLITPVFFDQMSFKAKRPKDMSLNCSKISNNLEIQVPSYEDGLIRLHSLLDGILKS